MTRFKKCQFPWEDCDTIIKPPFNFARVSQAGFGTKHRGCKYCGNTLKNRYKICDFHYIELKEEGKVFMQNFVDAVDNTTGATSNLIAFDADGKQIIHKAGHAKEITLSSQRLDKRAVD